MSKYLYRTGLALFLSISLAAIATPLFANPGKPPALLNGQPITEDEVMQKANKRMMKILTEMYEIKREVVEEIIDDRLLQQEAKTKSTTVPNLLQKASAGVAAPTEEEAKTIYEIQQNRAFKGKSFDEVKSDIIDNLRLQKKRTAEGKFLASLRGKAAIEINLERPSVEVSVDDDPAQGPIGAPITLIEFSEFQCPFCKRTRPTIAKVLETYNNKVRYVFRDFPLSFHKDAKPAANAANCAHEQKKYWEFNAKMFENQTNLGMELYNKTAQELGINMDQFNKCVASDKYADEIDADQEDGIKVGVTGTPAYFINGKFLSGAQPFEAFKELIDEELAKKGK